MKRPFGSITVSVSGGSAPMLGSTRSCDTPRNASTIGSGNSGYARTGLSRRPAIAAWAARCAARPGSAVATRRYTASFGVIPARTASATRSTAPSAPAGGGTLAVRSAISCCSALSSHTVFEASAGSVPRATLPPVGGVSETTVTYV